MEKYGQAHKLRSFDGLLHRDIPVLVNLHSMRTLDVTKSTYQV